MDSAMPRDQPMKACTNPSTHVTTDATAITAYSATIRFRVAKQSTTKAHGNAMPRPWNRFSTNASSVSIHTQARLMWNTRPAVAGAASTISDTSSSTASFTLSVTPCGCRCSRVERNEIIRNLTAPSMTPNSPTRRGLSSRNASAAGAKADPDGSAASASDCCTRHHCCMSARTHVTSSGDNTSRPMPPPVQPSASQGRVLSSSHVSSTTRCNAASDRSKVSSNTGVPRFSAGRYRECSDRSMLLMPNTTSTSW
mmetsp:Transcript_88345/g.214221  ORF Transcript_88345/g.214221 Transcript_88345/m.214221 type:complete len:254 (-) Transcript_88345:421-1182(-)